MSVFKTLDHPRQDIEQAEQAVDLNIHGAMHRLALAKGEVCGNCKHFSLHEGQRLIESTRFLGTLVKEHKWKVEALGAQPDKLGDCGRARSGSAGDDTMLTQPLAMACEEFKRK